MWYFIQATTNAMPSHLTLAVAVSDYDEKPLLELLQLHSLD